MALATVGMHSSCRKERKNKNEEEKKREEAKLHLAICKN
jgi:hypothetical protein